MKAGFCHRDEFPSSSIPGVIYTVLTYADGTRSCNCPAWTRRVRPDGSRDCKHLHMSPTSIPWKIVYDSHKPISNTNRPITNKPEPVVGRVRRKFDI